VSEAGRRSTGQGGHRQQRSFNILNNAAMKITLHLDDRLLTAAKVLAVQQRTSLTCLIEESLRLRLKSETEPTQPSHLPVFRGKGGLVDGVSGLSNKEMLDAVDRDA
jgi:hypothetical protein